MIVAKHGKTRGAEPLVLSGSEIAHVLSLRAALIQLGDELLVRGRQAFEEVPAALKARGRRLTNADKILGAFLMKMLSTFAFVNQMNEIGIVIEVDDLARRFRGHRAGG